MPTAVSYPGVYVEERSSGVRTIAGVATSITAFLGTARRGPETPTMVTSFGEFDRIFGGLDPRMPLGYAVRDFFTNGGSLAVIVRLYATPAGSAARASFAVTNLAMEAASAGAWGNNLRVRIDKKPNNDPNLAAAAARLGVAPADLFDLTVRDGATGAIESFLNLSTKDSARRADRVLAAESMLVRVASSLTLPNDNSPTNNAGALTDADVWTAGNKSTPATSSPASAVAADSDTLKVADYGDPGKKSGVFALEQTDLINLLCILADSPTGDVPDGVYSTALDYCVTRRAVLIVDPKRAWNDVSTVQNGVAGLNLTGPRARNAAVYFPTVRMPDPMLDGQIETFPPCGILAGVMARTDAQRGVWKAPAGTDASLNGVVGLATELTDLETGQLNPLGINCLRTFPGFGRVAWGARTMRGADTAADEYKYLPVRRTALFIEETLFRGLRWVVFEPNDEPLWSQIRLNVGAFMNTLFRQGAFQGATPRDAYFVKCDKDTTTQNDINLGIVNVVVGFAPLKPAEFVIITLQQMAGQVQG
jgi:phage tail sheath protein FI